MKYKRGEIYLADLGIVNEYCNSSVQRGFRPVLIIQNDVTTTNSSCIIIAPITSKKSKKLLRTHVPVGYESGINKQSMILLEQIQTIDKNQLTRKIGEIDEEKLKLVREAIIFSLNL